jgi:hypothetical protein
MEATHCRAKSRSTLLRSPFRGVATVSILKDLKSVQNLNIHFTRYVTAEKETKVGAGLPLHHFTRQSYTIQGETLYQVTKEDFPILFFFLSSKLNQDLGFAC